MAGREWVLGQVATIVYGLYGFTHGWARVLTVISPEGAAAAAGCIDADEQVEMVAHNLASAVRQAAAENAA